MVVPLLLCQKVSGLFLLSFKHFNSDVMIFGIDRFFRFFSSYPPMFYLILDLNHIFLLQETKVFNRSQKVELQKDSSIDYD